MGTELIEISFTVTAAGWAPAVAVGRCEAVARDALSGLPAFPVTCGDLSCGACHIYLPHELIEGAIGAEENELLNFTDAPRRSGSRLACQVHVSESWRGATVEIATPARRGA
jgi:ferredoxin